MDFELEEGKVTFKKEKTTKKEPAITLKLTGERLSKIQQIVIDSGYTHDPKWSEATKASHDREAVLMVAEKLLDWGIAQHSS